MTNPPLGRRMAAHRADVAWPPTSQFYSYAFRPDASPFALFSFRRLRRAHRRVFRVRNADLRRQGSPLRVSAQHPAPYIPLHACIDGHVYRIHARNFSIGVFRKHAAAFDGIREKFGWHYLFSEFHYDTGPPFGTVSPLEDLGPLPRPMVESELFAYLDATYHKGRCARENDMEQIQAIMEAARATKSPVIVQASRGARKFTNDIFLRNLMQATAELYTE